MRSLMGEYKRDSLPTFHGKRSNRFHRFAPQGNRGSQQQHVRASHQADSTILDALYGWDSPHSNFNPLMGLNNAYGDMLLNFVMAMMFIVLPAFWVTALAWAGVRAGNVAQMFDRTAEPNRFAVGEPIDEPCRFNRQGEQHGHIAAG